MNSLTFTRSGTTDAPAIIFLHGMAMGQWMWHDQVQHFADYDCYNVDLPGHGGSVAWESFNQTADCVAAFIDKTIGDKAVYLVGMSLGAVTGLHLLVRHPERITKAVMTGAFADAPPRLQMQLQGGLMSAILPTRFGKQIFARMLHIPDEAMSAYQESIHALSMPSFKQMIQEMADFKPLANLNTITTPSLFVTGEKDIPFNREGVRQLAERVPGSVGVYAPGVHHGWNGENPDLFNAMTRAWIEDKPLPPELLAVELRNDQIAEFAGT